MLFSTEKAQRFKHSSENLWHVSSPLSLEESHNHYHVVLIYSFSSMVILASDRFTFLILARAPKRKMFCFKILILCELIPACWLWSEFFPWAIGHKDTSARGSQTVRLEWHRPCYLIHSHPKAARLFRRALCWKLVECCTAAAHGSALEVSP